MSDQNQENLKELFEKFLSDEQATKAVEDVHKAEQIIRLYPAPEPEKELIANIKFDIASNLRNRQVHFFRTIAYRVATVAAAVIIVAVIGFNLFHKNIIPEKLVYASIMPRAFWESNNVAADDVDLAVFTAEAEQIKDEMYTLQLGKSQANIDDAVTEMEMNLIEIESDFWKG